MEQLVGSASSFLGAACEIQSITSNPRLATNLQAGLIPHVVVE
jgi:hypothetical protein